MNHDYTVIWLTLKCQKTKFCRQVTIPLKLFLHIKKLSALLLNSLKKFLIFQKVSALIQNTIFNCGTSKFCQKFVITQ